MLKQKLTALSVGAFVVALGSCRADREVFDEGATMETPPAVEQAPATPIPPQPWPPAGEAPVTEPMPQDTLPARGATPGVGY